MIKEPAYLTEARKHIGVAEIPGARHNATIQSWLRSLRAWWDDDETPWCGVFVAHCVRAANMPLPKNWMRARAWLEWGNKLDSPRLGCVVVFSRNGGGHVGFVVGRDNAGRLLVLGGNQGNRVSIAPFDLSRVVGYRAPVGVTLPSSIPVLTSQAASSTNEA